MLSENQINWIFEKCRRLANKYIAQLPLDDNTWHEFFEESKKIEESARHDELTVQLLIAIGTYLGKENERLRKFSFRVG